MSLIARSSSQSAFGNACTGGANLKNHFSPLAPPVQTEKTTIWPLHRRCKHFQKRFGHRVTPAETLCWRYSYIELTLLMNTMRFTCRKDVPSDLYALQRIPERCISSTYPLQNPHSMRAITNIPHMWYCRAYGAPVPLRSN